LQVATALLVAGSSLTLRLHSPARTRGARLACIIVCG